MFITWHKTEFRIHDSQSGNIMFVKSMPEDILDAQLSGNQAVITTKRQTSIFKRIGNTFAFSFFRAIPH